MKRKETVKLEISGLECLGGHGGQLCPVWEGCSCPDQPGSLSCHTIAHEAALNFCSLHCVASMGLGSSHSPKGEAPWQGGIYIYI